MNTPVTPDDFLARLRTKMSGFNAGLVLDAAMIESGINTKDRNQELSEVDIKNLCLKLIQKGGPAFYVGQAMYRENLQ